VLRLIECGLLLLLLLVLFFLFFLFLPLPHLSFLFVANDSVNSRIKWLPLRRY